MNKDSYSVAVLSERIAENAYSTSSVLNSMATDVFRIAACIDKNVKGYQYHITVFF
jgi:hypothetical protein